MNDKEKNRLLELLNKCGNALLEHKERLYMGSLFFTYEELGEFLLQCVREIEDNDYTQIRDLWFVFAPTGDFDDAVGNIEFAEEVYTLINTLFREHLISHPNLNL